MFLRLRSAFHRLYGALSWLADELYPRGLLRDMHPFKEELEPVRIHHPGSPGRNIPKRQDDL
eukprot:CAMPEP_0119541064 /NCGR_PEP_ID=MMETSP1344-20130328/52739_1 /TAXON_ID=236787 /ORGANISM="Florenciella parvula, Strain CCMP2471" /LENGTH=61 /DNA_ID=CAMNT_0007584977 /DNA_START=250 /DNA_END=435 /DNA_ORIENTATION=-